MNPRYQSSRSLFAFDAGQELSGRGLESRRSESENALNHTPPGRGKGEGRLNRASPFNLKRREDYQRDRRLSRPPPPPPPPLLLGLASFTFNVRPPSSVESSS